MLGRTCPWWLPALSAGVALGSGCGSPREGSERPANRVELPDAAAPVDSDGPGPGGGGASAAPEPLEPSPDGEPEPAPADGASALDGGVPVGGAPGDPIPADPDLPPTSEVDEACLERVLPDQPLRRLSSDEYHNTLRDLFGGDLGRRVVDGSLFPVTSVRSGFASDAEANVVNTAESNAIEDNAERIAALVDQDPVPFLRGLLPCSLPDTIADPDIDGCIDGFIDGFGLRAYRRPVTDSERALARGVYDAVRASAEARFAFSALVQYFVQAPALLYRVERGSGGPDAALLRLDGYERATRLSYFLTGSMPDDELLEAARADALGTPAELRFQAERLLGQERFFEVADRFHRDWLELHGFEYKEASLFPEFDGARASLEQETSRYVRHVLSAGDGSIGSLLGGSELVLNDVLASYYGVAGTSSGVDDWVPTSVPNRRGLLTHGALMAALAGSTGTNPIHRGAFVQTQILCRTLPALPGGLDIQSPLADTSGLPTARERLSPLLERSDCSGCHTVINPVGLAFENFDAAGRWRDSENDAAILAAGSLVLDGNDVAFDGPVALAESLAASHEAQMCYARNWYRFALGRPEFEQDACSLALVEQAVRDSQGDFREVVLSVVESDAFSFRRRVEP